MHDKLMRSDSGSSGMAARLNSTFERPIMSSLIVTALDGIPEVSPGDDIAAMIGEALVVSGEELRRGDILVVTSKIVSKAEGRQLKAADREAAITAETVRLVASREHPGGVTRIVENRQGLVLAAAGVDNSNTAEGTVLLLPEDPDGSARRLCTALRSRYGVTVGVVLSELLDVLGGKGRPMRP